MEVNRRQIMSPSGSSAVTRCRLLQLKVD